MFCEEGQHCIFGECHNSTVCLCNDNLCNDFQVERGKKSGSTEIFPGERECYNSSSGDDDDDQPDDCVLLRGAEERERQPGVDSSDLWLRGNILHASL